MLTTNYHSDIEPTPAMKILSRHNTNIRLLVILWLSICLRVSNAYKKSKWTTTDKDFAHPKVTILQGSIRGINLTTKNNRNVAGFLGIPFAQPPVGNLRFKAPVAASSWVGTLNASSNTADCPQLSLTDATFSGNEDCLYTNVYTPKLPKNRNSKLLPVMMYIHGGGNIVGSNNSTLYGPGYLLDKDVVLVVPSYRLAALGFLSTGDEASPGNWGLKDLVLALKWIRDNIKFFGGDPDQVTILGNSAGSIAVNYLTLSDLTTGLIHRYITQSGSGLSTLGYQPTDSAVKTAFRLGGYVGCAQNTSAPLVACLRSLNVEDILNASPQFIEWGVFPRSTWLVTIEPELEGAVLTDTPENLLASGKIDDLPGIIGTVPEDGIVLSGYFYSNPDKFEEFITIFDDVLPLILSYGDKVQNVSAYTNALKSYYFNNDLTSDRTILLSNLTRLCGDVIGNFPNDKELQQLAASYSTYLYSFEYRGTFSYSYVWTNGSIEDFGVSHSDELIYLFPQSEALFAALNRTMSETDLEMVDTMVELWTSFASCGMPRCTVFAESWSPYSENMETLRIGNLGDVSAELEVQSSDDAGRIQFLRNLDVIRV